MLQTELEELVIGAQVANGVNKETAECFNGYELEECFYGKDGFDYGGFNIILEDEFGGEGQGDDIWKVFKIEDMETKEKTYFKVRGYYDSWNGTDWDGTITLAKPVEVTVIQWEDI